MTDTEYYLPGETFSRTLTFTDETDALFDPTTIASVIKNPAGTTLTTLAITDLTRVSIGVYQLSYLLDVAATVGQYSLSVTSTDSLFTQKETFYFSVVNPTVGYCSIEDVKSLVTFDFSDGKTLMIIADADAELNDLLDGETMTTANKKYCSMRLAAITIAQKQRTEIRSQDGESTELGWNIREWKAEVKTKVSRIVRGERWIVVDPLAE